MLNDPNLTVGRQTKGTQSGNDWDTSGDTVPKKAYATVQTQLNKAKAQLKEYEDKAREGMDVEQQLQEERTQRSLLEGKLARVELKANARPELHDFIDRFSEKYGKVPDEEDLEFFESQLPKAEKKTAAKPATTQQTAPATTNTSSGMRNSSARVPDTDAELDEQLKSVRLDDVPSFGA